MTSCLVVVLYLNVAVILPFNIINISSIRVQIILITQILTLLPSFMHLSLFLHNKCSWLIDQFALAALFYSPVDSPMHQTCIRVMHVWCIGAINRWIKQRSLCFISVIYFTYLLLYAIWHHKHGGCRCLFTLLFRFGVLILCCVSVVESWISIVHHWSFSKRRKWISKIFVNCMNIRRLFTVFPIVNCRRLGK